MISIIIPIYNVEKYLEDCLLSIQKQTYTNFECIMVNDGSTDTSPIIAQTFVERDNRFKLLHQENSGQSEARNNGLQRVKGDYFTFIDSDDIVHYSFLEDGIKNIGQADIAEFKITRFYNAEIPNMTDDETLYHEVFYQTPLEAIKAISEGRLSNSPCAKLFRSELKTAIHFPKGSIGEDLYVNLGLYKKGYTVKTIDKVVYFYRTGHTSMMTGSFSERDWELFDICEQIEEAFKDDVELQPYIYKILTTNILDQYLNKTNFSTKGRNRHKQKIREYGKKAASTSQKFKLSIINLDLTWCICHIINTMRSERIS